MGSMGHLAAGRARDDGFSQASQRQIWGLKHSLPPVSTQKLALVLFPSSDSVLLTTAYAYVKTCLVSSRFIFLSRCLHLN